MPVLVTLYLFVYAITSSIAFRMTLKMSINPIKKPISTNVILSGGDFKELVTQSSIFVDKSLLIKGVLEGSNKITLITMPRRWGKSVNLDMLRRFLSIDIDQSTGCIIQKNETDNYKIFAGGKIPIGTTREKILGKLKIAEYEDIMTDYLGKYPVIYLDFKDCKKNTFAEIKKSVLGQLLLACQSFPLLATSEKMCLTIPIKDRYKEIVAGIKSGEDFKNSLKMLSMLLYTQFNEKVWILIDEYDAAANEAYRNLDIEEAKKVAKLFRYILEPALKGNEYLYKGVLTGVQCIVKSGMLSGLNNLGKYSVQDYTYSQYYGVNENEMELLLSHFNIPDDQRNNIREWYNGYREKIPNTNKYVDKYNIWSVIKYLNNPSLGFKSYWEESTSFEFIVTLLRRKEILDEINILIDGGPIYFKFKIDFSVDEFKILKQLINLDENQKVNADGRRVLFSYLYIAGYLTEDGNRRYKIPIKK